MKKFFVFIGFILVISLAIWFEGGISIQAADPLSRPDLLSPSRNAKISVPPIILDWSDVSGAGVYNYEYWNSYDKIYRSGIVSASEFQFIDTDIIWGVDYDWKARACADSSLSNCGLWSKTEDFKTVDLPSGLLTINTVNSSKWKPELMDRSSICTGSLGSGPRCKEIYDSCRDSSGKVVSLRCHLTLAASFLTSFNYNIYFIDTEKNGSVSRTLEIGDVLKLKIEKPEGEWFFSGGSFDSPPITWISDAQTAYNNMVSITSLHEYRVNANQFDKDAKQSLKPKMGVAATEPLKQADFSVKSNDNLEVFQQESDYYIRAIKPGIGTVDVDIPSVFAYSTIDNLWFEGGSIPGATENFTFSVIMPQPPSDPDPDTSNCNDGTDNDGDGQTDFPDDPGCADAADDDETDPGHPDPPGSSVLDISFSASPNSCCGCSSLDSTLTAVREAASTTTGPIEYEFDCDNNGTFEYTIPSSSNDSESYAGCPAYTGFSTASVTMTQSGVSQSETADIAFIPPSCSPAENEVCLGNTYDNGCGTGTCTGTKICGGGDNSGIWQEVAP